MPFKGNRIWFLVGGIAFIVLLLVAWAASAAPPVDDPMPTPTPTPPVTGDVSVTVLNNIGVHDIEIENMNTGKKYVATLLGLPLSFNCTRGDYLKLRVVIHEGYRWNAWWFSPMDIFNHDNPAIIPTDGKYTSNGQIIMRPDTLISEQPAVTPTLSPPPE